MEDLRPGPLLGLAGFVVMGAGVSMVASAAQLILGFWFGSFLIALWPYTKLVLGAASVLLGGALTQGRDWAAIGSILTMGIGVLGGMIWVVYALTSGLFTLVSVFAVGMCLLGLVLTPIGLGRALKLSAARRELLRDVEL